jgi:hypothetical protein
MQSPSSRAVSLGPSGAIGRRTAAPASISASASGLASSSAGTARSAASPRASSQSAAPAARPSSSRPDHARSPVTTAGPAVACAA